MMHICTVATLCFPEKTFPRNYYYCVQDENSLCLCFKNMYRTLFVAIFTSTFIFSMYDHIGLPGCVFPYLSKYKYQQSNSTPSPFKTSLSYFCTSSQLRETRCTWEEVSTLKKCLVELNWKWERRTRRWKWIDMDRFKGCVLLWCSIWSIYVVYNHPWECCWR